MRLYCMKREARACSKKENKTNKREGIKRNEDVHEEDKKFACYCRRRAVFRRFKKKVNKDSAQTCTDTAPRHCWIGTVMREGQRNTEY